MYLNLGKNNYIVRILGVVWGGEVMSTYLLVMIYLRILFMDM